MANRLFRIDIGIWGGELTIGQVNEDFVKHFIDKDEQELLDYMSDWSCGDADEDIPTPVTEECEYYDINDIEWIDGSCGNTEWSFVELPIDVEPGTRESMDNEREGEKFEAYHLYDREAYFADNEDDKENYPGKVVPVLMYYATEKGSMGCWFVETEGEDFDPKKVAYSTVCTNIEEMLDSVWYDKEELEEQNEWKSTNGKGLYASVGWMNLDWHDTIESKAKEIDECWEYFDEENET
jgi:hypothetical protein